jgi:Uma2 family endonuclease
MLATDSHPLAELRKISVQEYHRMAEVEILKPDDAVELLAGQIFYKMPKGTAHSAAVKRIEKLLERQLRESALVRLQDPVCLDDFSEPEPDIAVVHSDPNFYEDHHPTPTEIYLIIEVADTTLSRDLGTKANLYAQAGIADYWVLDVSHQQLHIFREPRSDGYQSQLILREQGQISLLAFPECAIAVRDMLSTSMI